MDLHIHPIVLTDIFYCRPSCLPRANGLVGNCHPGVATACPLCLPRANGLGGNCRSGVATVVLEWQLHVFCACHVQMVWLATVIMEWQLHVLRACHNGPVGNCRPGVATACRACHLQMVSGWQLLYPAVSWSGNCKSFLVFLGLQCFYCVAYYYVVGKVV